MLEMTDELRVWVGRVVELPSSRSCPTSEGTELLMLDSWFAEYTILCVQMSVYKVLCNNVIYLRTNRIINSNISVFKHFSINVI